MKFVVSSTDLLWHLQAIQKVISTKNSVPILDNFLIEQSGNELIITASDLETTLTTKMVLENAEGEGVIAIDAKRLTDILREFPEQPLTFDINEDTLGVEILSQNGKFNIIGQHGDDFPKKPELKDEVASTINMPSEVLLNGISKAIFATADDEMRPVMSGIFVELSSENIRFVASDSHKLVKYQRNDVSSDGEASFILPKKPAGLLKNILPRDEEPVSMRFDDKNAFFSFASFDLVCRLTEGAYPSYDSVIPKENPNKMIINRIDFFNSLKRVSVFSNQASNLVKFKLVNNQITISAQDIDFSISAYENLNCQYDGDEMEIGFKSNFLQEILNNLGAQEVTVEMSDPSRAGLVIPVQKENDSEDVLMLIMPMMINS